MKQGCKFVSVVGLCWGGLIAQRILSLGKLELKKAKWIEIKL